MEKEFKCPVCGYICDYDHSDRHTREKSDQLIRPFDHISLVESVYWEVIGCPECGTLYTLDADIPPVHWKEDK